MLVYLPDDVKNCEELKQAAERCLNCEKERPCVLGCPQRLDLATALDFLREAVFIEGDEKGVRLVVLPTQVIEALRMKKEADRCQGCPEPTPGMTSCPLEINVCDAIRVVGRAIVAGIPSELELI
jgi:NADPH-dependent glutamate synthase beta subunit-like oxidoreductase